MAFFQNLSCPDAATRSSAGFKSVYKPKVGGVRFADLLDQVSSVDPEVTILTSFARSVRHKAHLYKGQLDKIEKFTVQLIRDASLEVLIGYCDYLGTRPKNVHRPIIVTGQ